jgi:hypothetical protein
LASIGEDGNTPALLFEEGHVPHLRPSKLDLSSYCYD